jgi:pyruvate dehydrogenase E1 component beta subunit
LLKTAIRDPNPVVFIEQKLLYRQKGPVPDPNDDYSIPLGLADVKRKGKDLTIVTYGRMVPRCLEAAGKLAADGSEAEVIDIRSLVPLDKKCIVASVKWTGRVAFFLKHTLINERSGRDMPRWAHSGFSAILSVKIASASSIACLHVSL